MSNSILSLAGIESRIAKLDSVLSGIIPTVVADAPAAAADVGAIVGGVAGAIAAPATAIGSIGPVANGFLGLLQMIEGLVAGIEAATATGSDVPASTGVLTGAEVAGPNKA